MQCFTIEFLLVFLLNTQSYEIVLKQECEVDKQSDETTTEFRIETSFKPVEILSYNHNDKFYYAKLKD